MSVYGNEKERIHAKAQKEKRVKGVKGIKGGAKKKGFHIKEAVKNMKKIRAAYAEETQNHSLLNKGFRARIEVIKPEDDIKKTHTLKDLSPSIPNMEDGGVKKRKRTYQPNTKEDMAHRRQIYQAAHDNKLEAIRAAKKARPKNSKVKPFDPSDSGELVAMEISDEDNASNVPNASNAKHQSSGDDEGGFWHSVNTVAHIAKTVWKSL